jgi:hypothetical protein
VPFKSLPRREWPKNGAQRRPLATQQKQSNAAQPPEAARWRVTKAAEASERVSKRRAPPKLRSPRRGCESLRGGKGRTQLRAAERAFEQPPRREPRRTARGASRY